MNQPKRTLVMSAAAMLLISGCSDTGPQDGPGREVWEANCRVCHLPGLAGAPVFGNTEDWAPRIERGMDALYRSALEGTGEMPARGGKDLPDDQVREAVDYMVNNSRT